MPPEPVEGLSLPKGRGASTGSARMARFRGRGVRTFGRSRSPPKPSRAGSRVNAISTAMATPIAAATPMVVRKGIRATASPHRAMITVRPAKTTADPAVATARAADSSGSIPSRSWSRCREVMNRA